MIKLFNIPHHRIDTSIYSNLLHDPVVDEFENRFADYVGAKYGVAVSSATSAIFLSLLGKDTSCELPTMLPPTVVNAVLTSGNRVTFRDDTEWLGSKYVLKDFGGYKIIDSAQELKRGQFKNDPDCKPQDLMIFSFYPTKPLGGIDGGIIVSDDKYKIQKLRSLSFYGQSKDEDSWDRSIIFPGYKMYMNSVQAHILMRNMDVLEEKMERLDGLVETYNERLGIKNTSRHLYRIDTKNNLEFVQLMKKLGVQCGIHYACCHQMQGYLDSCGEFSCPDSESDAKRAVTLPMNEKIENWQIDFILNSVRSCYGDLK